jgi:hypothetical protein
VTDTPAPGMTISCQEVVETSPTTWRERCPPTGHREVHEHLFGCADCLRYLGQVRVTSRLLARLPTRELTDELNAELTNVFRAAPDRHGPADGTAG